MKKLASLTLLLALISGAATARVTAITDWSDSMSERVSDPKQAAATCAEKCPGYDLTTTYCYTTGEVLESCPEEGCRYYHRCVAEQ